MYVLSSVEGVCTEFGGRCMYRVRWKVYVLSSVVVYVLSSVVSVCTEFGGKVYVQSSVVGVCTEFGGRCMYRVVRW